MVVSEGIKRACTCGRSVEDRGTTEVFSCSDTCCVDVGGIFARGVGQDCLFLDTTFKLEGTSFVGSVGWAEEAGLGDGPEWRAERR